MHFHIWQQLHFVFAFNVAVDVSDIAGCLTLGAWKRHRLSKKFGADRNMRDNDIVYATMAAIYSAPEDHHGNEPELSTIAIVRASWCRILSMELTFTLVASLSPISDLRINVLWCGEHVLSSLYVVWGRS
jgi:hypothetical protein